MGDVPSVTIGVWVDNGSRYESVSEGGLSHFLEHLIFKGTRRRSAVEIAQVVDSVGGAMNAMTGKESTCYMVRTLAEDVDVAFDVLFDAFLESVFDPEELERERTVVLQEIAEIEDVPEELVHEMFDARTFGDHPLGRPICGTRESVSALGRDDVVRFFRDRHRSEDVVVVAAGRIRHEEVLARCRDAFAEVPSGRGRPPSETPTFRSGVHALARDLEQAHLVFGWPAIPYGAPDRHAAFLLNAAFGGGMSSRLFQEIREKRGLAYAVDSHLSSFRDTGVLGVSVGTSRQSVPEVVRLVLGELDALARDGLAPEELERTKRQLRANVLLGLETSEAQMFRVGREELFLGGATDPGETIRRVEAVTAEEVRDLAGRLCRREALSLVLLGDVPDAADLLAA